MNSDDDGWSAAMVPEAIASACAALCRRTNSLNDATSSSLEIACAGVKRPVPVSASAGTPYPPVFLGSKLAQPGVKGKVRHPPHCHGPRMRATPLGSEPCALVLGPLA